MSANYTNVKVLYEDEDILVVNKPAGLVVHPASPAGGPDGRTEERALTDWLLQNYPTIKGVGEPLTLSSGEIIDRPGIVHRLDRETSGVMLVAKNQKAHEALKKQFQNHEVEKIYNAFVYGKMPEEKGVIDRPIGRSATDFRLWSAQRGARGELRPAVTEYRVLESSPEFSFLEVSPKTGRTHQIRVHLKAVNHPVICDKLYAPKRECALGFSRAALHSRQIGFTDLSGVRQILEAPLPEDFEKALREMEKTAP